MNYGGKEVKLGELKHHVFMFKLVDKRSFNYRAFCAGSIISEERVLSSAHCFYTNRKRYRVNLKQVKVVGGVLQTHVQQTTQNSVQQWREVVHIFTQKFFRFPAYNLAVVQLNAPWNFDQFVNKIPYAVMDQNFDGVCQATAVRSMRSWSKIKALFTEEFRMLTRRDCERIILKSCRLYHCTEYDTRKLILNSVESEGGGLVCHGTGDPQEVDERQGILVGVTALIHYKLPTMHHKIAIFHQWVTDSATETICRIGFRVRVSRKGDYSTFCGGSLIGPDKIVSAAHCFKSFYKGSGCSSIIEVSQRDLSKVFAVAGSLLTRDRYRKNAEGQWRRLSKVLYPSRFKFPDYDICVAMLIKPFKYNQNVAPIKYNRRFEDYGGSYCLASGYGLTSRTGKGQSPILLKAYIQILSNRQCMYVLGKSRKFICTVYGMTDTGKGDSGGPVVCTSNNARLLTGVVCGHRVGVGSFFTRISSHMKFVETNRSSRYDLKSMCYYYVIVIAIIRNFR